MTQISHLKSLVDQATYISERQTFSLVPYQFTIIMERMHSFRGNINVSVLTN